MSKKDKPQKEPLKERKIFVVGGDLGYINWMQGVAVDRMEDADLVVFAGGEDVDPRLYGDVRHPLTYSNYERDKREVDAYVKAKVLRKPCLGICRGSQFLCVMNGGVLVQDQNNPAFMHKMHCRDIDSHIWVTSTQHQAQLPHGNRKGHLILGFTTGTSGHHSRGDGSEIILCDGWEAEVVVYHGNPGDLGIQSHPEMVYDGRTHDPRIKQYIDWCQNLLNEFLKGDIIASWCDIDKNSPPILSPFVEWKEGVPVGPTEAAIKYEQKGVEIELRDAPKVQGFKFAQVAWNHPVEIREP